MDKGIKMGAFILMIGIVALGYFIKSGLDNFTNKDRVVNVKGLAEMEVKANKVTWPLVYKDLGNDLPMLYTKINKTNLAIISFLKKSGIAETEISVNAPEIIDMQAERYNTTPSTYRYNVTSVIIVTSNKVEKVRKLISEQSELLKQGIAVSGGDYRYNVQYDYTDLNTIKPQMIEEATKNARSAAEKFAKDSDSELGKIRRASQGQFSIIDRDPNTPYIKNVRVVTTIDYTLED
ncbi:MAG: SIMPL domain-containing protein [Bacteroides sp.]